ncbi:DUF2642 domain-containing protein [Domibacillus epiphyticus]|uniref:DUF2642 domain-containing protein n=1 Tax=Domibacillus epiphyticus TaxID=1714355 RepID=A0A1V2ABM0_9BACI|nr:DUF2642 domain-containing protein [Domibacillus epiphyticus]OMP68395.1 hypothetical protein BTO28_01890 [Domibacillus epiphyticus]
MSGPYFSETLTSLIGYSIGIFSDDGNIIKGSLVDVKQDYLILQNEKEEYFYHHLDQIKSVSKNAKDLHSTTFQLDYLQAENLHELLDQCKQSWVTINCHNDQMLTGFLSRVFEDHLILISGEEKIIIQNSYIANVFPGFYEKDVSAEDVPEENMEIAEKETETLNNLNEKKKIKRDQQLPPLEEQKEKGKEQKESDITCSEAVENTADKKETFAADISSQTNQSTERLERKKYFEKSDSSLSDRMLRLNLTPRKKGEFASKKESDKKNQSESADASSFKRVYFQKIRADKKIIMNKKGKKLQAQNHQKPERKSMPLIEENHTFTQPVITQEEKEKILESQYYSLMKQAERDYMNLRRKRMNRQKMKQSFS